MRCSLAPRSAATLAALAAVALMALTLSGCAWLGQGKTVADAFANTKAAKTGAFSLTLNVNAPRRRQAKPVNETVAIQGAYDQTDPNNAKFRLTEAVGKESVAIVAPGNGRVYMTIDGETSSEKIPKTVAPTAQQQALSDKFSDALAGAFVNFRDAPPVVRSDGTQIQGIAADVSRNKLCGPAVRSIVRTLNGSKLLGKSKGDRIPGRATRAFSRICSQTLVGNPLVTFGLDGGYVWNINLTGQGRSDRRVFTVSLALEFSGLNQPQTGFDIPSGGTKKIGVLHTEKLHAAVERAASYSVRP